MFMLVYISKFVQIALSFLLLGRYDNVQASHRYGGKSENALKNSWKERTVQRAFAAHCNQWEAFIGFSVSVLLALLKAPHQHAELTFLANSFVYIRIIYNIAYILAFNEPLSFLRSSVFTVGLVVILKIFALAANEIYV